MSSMIGSVHTVRTKISGVISSSITRSSEMSCESFVSLVKQFLSIADEASQEDTIQVLATNIAEATVETCTQKQGDILKNASDSLDDITILLQNILDALMDKLTTLLEKLPKV